MKKVMNLNGSMTIRGQDYHTRWQLVPVCNGSKYFHEGRAWFVCCCFFVC